MTIRYKPSSLISKVTMEQNPSEEETIKILPSGDLNKNSAVDPVCCGSGSGALGPDLWKIFKIPLNEFYR